MAKYDPLRDYLRKQKLDEFELTFAEMERKIGYMLPRARGVPSGGPTPPPRTRRSYEGCSPGGPRS
jgi:hypothetical protein